MTQLAAKRGYGLVDAYAALGADLATYVQGDGVHPTEAGSTRWAEVTQELFQPWPAY